MESTFSEFANYSRLALALEEMRNFRQAKDLDRLAEDLVQCIGSGHKVLIFGNGGSAAEASHFAAELVSKCSRDHLPWPAISLSDSNSIITAIANDYGYEKVFQRQLQAYLQPGDVVVGLSTSGRSRNVLAGLEYSSQSGAPTYLLTGSVTDIGVSDRVIRIHANLEDTPRIQELHLVWIHLLSEFCEQRIT